MPFIPGSAQHNGFAVACLYISQINLANSSQWLYYLLKTYDLLKDDIDVLENYYNLIGLHVSKLHIDQDSPINI